jgi:serine/threonine protein kinase
LYSLGAVGYFLLTGRPPFEAASVLEIIRRQVEEKPAPISEKAPKPMAAELERVLMACLEKSPSARPQSAAELAEVLANCTPREPWTAADSERWWSQQQPAAAAAAAPTQAIELGATIGYSTAERKE